MPAEPFRFVQAADLHLEQPIHGLADVPDHLKSALIDAPYAAAERVFDATLAESADFLVLAGDVLNVSQAGPRAIVFLLEQFERLAARDIAVYWAGGEEDSPEEWPTAAKLPANVHFYSRGEVEEITHYRHEHPLCLVAGASNNGHRAVRPDDFQADPNGLFTIAVAHGRADAESLAERPVDYWALGGQHSRQSLYSSPRVAHYSGSTQGRSPAEAGPHGCTLAAVDIDGKCRTQLLITDTVRWHNERLIVEGDTTRDDLRRLLAERLLALTTEAGDRVSLVAWTIEVSGSLSEKSRLNWLARRATLAEELLNWLRADFGRQPKLWTASLEFEPPASLPQTWYEEDTILGDFLRAVQVHQGDVQQPLNVSAYLSPRQRDGALAAALDVQDLEIRRRVLREASALGIELLRGEAV